MKVHEGKLILEEQLNDGVTRGGFHEDGRDDWA
jgi:hypothetical protein